MTTYPWLNDQVDIANCKEVRISEYNLGSYAFVYVETPNSSIMYFETGAYWCESFPNYDCLSLYGLTQEKLTTELVCQDACSNIFSASTIEEIVTDCELGLQYCIDIPLSDTNEYDYFLNGESYANGFLGCKIDTIANYAYFSIPDRGANGPYQLEAWTVNEQKFNATIQTVQELVDSMQVWDPSGNWTIAPDLLQITGKFTMSKYGSLEVLQIATGASAILEVNSSLSPRGSLLNLPIGNNQLVIRDRDLGCEARATITVICQE